MAYAVPAIERGVTCGEIAAAFGVPPLAAGGVAAICAAYPGAVPKVTALYNYVRSHL